MCHSMTPEQWIYHIFRNTPRQMTTRKIPDSELNSMLHIKANFQPQFLGFRSSIPLKLYLCFKNWQQTMRNFTVEKCSFKPSTEKQLLINFAFKHQKHSFEISFLSQLEDDHTKLQKNPYCSSKPDNRRNIYNLFPQKRSILLPQTAFLQHS